MKIAILSKADATGGGASRIAQELCQLLNAAGHTAHHFLALYQNEPYPFARPLYGHYFLRRVVSRLNRYSKFWGFPELIPWEFPALLWQRINTYDVIHFHDLSSAISPLTIRWLSRMIPAVWTFHDCSPFTGGCLYPMACQKFTTRCGPCPQLGLWPLDGKFDFTSFMHAVKRKTAAENCFLPVTPSAWMSTTALASGMFSASPVVVQNGVDTDIFKPADRLTLKQKLGLSSHRPIILITAAYIYEARKGVRFALEALHRVKSLRPLLLIVGHLDNDSRVAFSGFETHETGYLQDNMIKSQYFAAADIHLFSSLADNLPLTILETMATATPTVGFATGGAPEMITHNHTGYRVPPHDVPGLATGIKLAFADDRVAEWGRNARQRVEELYSHEIFLSNHLALYQQVIRNFNQQ